jgi:uncharacterized repeat protein (TIGR03833 family)
MENQYLKNIKKGMNAEIMTDLNRMSRGVIDDVISRASFQMYGIRVRLANGDIGRVQRILSKDVKNEDEENIDNLLKKGENYYCEFKTSALWSVNYTEEDIKKSRSFDVHYFKQKSSKIIIAKSIAAFLNSNGGNLIIGVREKKDSGDIEVIGIKEEFKKLKDQYKDGYKRMIVDEIIRPYFPAKVTNHLNRYIEMSFVEREEKILCWIKIKKSDSRVFLKIDDKEIFMIRTETENRTLEGEKLVDYCIRHFG